MADTVNPIEETRQAWRRTAAGTGVQFCTHRHEPRSTPPMVVDAAHRTRAEVLAEVGRSLGRL